ncbi:acyltransferase [Mesorhizobium sp. L-8-10]|nr:acyltransferase [Mesorhizobium sp. L-8-10]
MSIEALRVRHVAASPEGRRHDLDWLRVLAFGMLIFYHVGMFYVTWDWHVKSPSASSFFEPAMLLVNPWRLALLFFISGVAIRFATDKVPLRRFLPKRVLRLFIPIVFGMLIVVMPQAYVEMRFKGETEVGLWRFFIDYATFRQEFSIITPTWNHLWYVVYILVYTLLLAPFLTVLRRLSGRPAGALLSWIGARPRLYPLVLPALPFLVYRLVLDPYFPTTHALADDWANHAHNLTILLYGFVVAKNQVFWRLVDKTFATAVVLAVSLGMLSLAVRLGWTGVPPDEMLQTAVRIGRIFYAWAVIVALLGLSQRWLDRPGTALRYLTDAVFPYYILHQTIIVVLGYWLIPYRLPALEEAAIIIGATLSGCVLGYEVIRRVLVLRPLFGLPWRRNSDRNGVAIEGGLAPAGLRSPSC